MLSVDEARERILRAFAPTSVEQVALLDALGLTLAEDAVSPMPLPRFDTAAMDGYAVRVVDLLRGSSDRPITLRVVGTAAAGARHNLELVEGTAIRIMTGALVPRGATAVVPFELTDDQEPGRRPTEIGVNQPCAVGANIRHAGTEIQRGAVALPAGVALGPGQLGLLSSLGATTARVYRRPRVAILSTGDEVVEPGRPLAATDIYDANGATLAAAVRAAGGQPLLLGIAPDRVDVLRQRLREAEGADLLITSGGVSHGDYDIVKDLLAEAGQVEFWQVAMKPGRPLGYGTIEGRPLIGVPGNPGAALVAFEQFIRPAIRKLLGRREILRPEIGVVVRGTASNRDGRRCFLRARVKVQDGTLVAILGAPRGVSTLTSFGDANAYVVVPESLTQVVDGDILTAQILDWGEV